MYVNTLIDMKTPLPATGWAALPPVGVDREAAGREKRQEHPADDRRRDVQAVEHAHPPPDAVARKQDQRGHGQRLDEVECECRHRVPAPLCGTSVTRD